MKRNIAISYLLTIAQHSWFWLGIWVLFYLRFTDYRGIGLIEMVLFTTMTLSEIPTGAIADIFGKKRTLFLSFLISSIGGFIYAFANDFSTLLFAVFILAIGATLYSGTLEALVYDTLKEHKQESKFESIIAHIGSLQFLIPAIFGIIGGFLYTINFRLPFILNALFYSFAMIATIFLVEPKIDSEKFSLSAFVNQTKQGFSQLFQSVSVKRQVILMLSIAVIITVMYEMLDSIVAVEYGFNAKSLGILWGVIYIISALISQLTPYILKKLQITKSFFITGFLYGVNLLVSPFVGLLGGGALLLSRSGLQILFDNFSKIYINSVTESRYRATTISTFNMLKNIPYVFLAVTIGYFADIFSGKTVAGFLGGFILFFLLIQLFFRDSRTKIKSSL